MKEKIKRLKNSKLLSIIMLILFYPVGLILLWLNKGFKKRTKIIFTLVSVFIIISISTMTEITPQIEPAVEQTETAVEQTEISKEEPKEEPKEEVKAPELTETEKQEQDKNYEKATFTANFKALDNVEFELNEGANINVIFDLSDNLTTKMTVTGYYLELKNTCKELKNNSNLDKYETVTFSAFTEFVNSYGETNRGKAISATIKVSDIKRIQYDNITTDQFRNIVDTTFTHPALRG